MEIKKVYFKTDKDGNRALRPTFVLENDAELDGHSFSVGGVAQTIWITEAERVQIQEKTKLKEEKELPN